MPSYLYKQQNMGVLKGSYHFEPDYLQEFNLSWLKKHGKTGAE